MMLVGATMTAVVTATAMATVTVVMVTVATKTAIATVAAARVTAAKKQRSTKSCSEKSGDNGGGRGVSGGSNGFDVCSGDKDGSGNSDGNDAVTEATTTAIATVAAATATAAKKNDQLKAAVEKTATMAVAEARGKRRQGWQERQASTRKCKLVPVLCWSCA